MRSANAWNDGSLHSLPALDVEWFTKIHRWLDNMPRLLRLWGESLRMRIFVIQYQQDPIRQYN